MTSALELATYNITSYGNAFIETSSLAPQGLRKRIMLASDTNVQTDEANTGGVQPYELVDFSGSYETDGAVQRENWTLPVGADG